MTAGIVLAAIAGDLMQSSQMSDPLLQGGEHRPKKGQHHRPNHAREEQGYDRSGIEVRNVVNHSELRGSSESRDQRLSGN